jgi:hypothetical protein
MKPSERSRGVRVAIVRGLLYLLPGLAAALGAVLAFLAASRATPALVAVTAVLIVLGLGGKRGPLWHVTQDPSTSPLSSSSLQA